jgi:hypothetical protein
MSRGIVRRRAAKAARRKKLLAERRNAALAATQLPLAERMRRLASTPLHSCLVQDDAFERGNGMVILTREAVGGGLIMAAFLIDVHCLGVKDVLFRQSDTAEIEAILAAMEDDAAFAPVDPSYARKLLRDCVAFARSLGIEPHRDYAATELLFGSAAADACDADFSFGYKGKPLYVPGPVDTPAEIRRRLAQLRRHLGEDGFEFAAATEDDDDFRDDGAPGYDPLYAPDPAEWLDLDEDERGSLVEAYHRRAGIDLPDEGAHTAIHVVVENQIALGDELPTRRAVERLMAEGLDRHEALHAVGSVLVNHMYDLAQAAAASPVSPDTYTAAVERLTVESWLRQGQEDGTPGGE